MAAGGSQVPATGNIGHWNAVVDEVRRVLHSLRTGQVILSTRRQLPTSVLPVTRLDSSPIDTDTIPLSQVHACLTGKKSKFNLSLQFHIYMNRLPIISVLLSYVGNIANICCVL